MKNIQIIDTALNATFSIFQATDEEFAEIFPGPGQDMELIEDALARLGDRAGAIISPMWDRPVHKRDANGIHGTLYYEYDDEERRAWIPKSKREIDRDWRAINQAERNLYARLRTESER